MSKIIEGLWDCEYCGEKGIGGLSKHCPNCGHPQGENTTFYMPKDITYLEEEKAKEYGKGADWVCSYCDSLNRYNAKFCVNCGAAKEENSGDYFSKEKERQEKNDREKEERKKKQQEKLEQRLKVRKQRRFAIIGILLALVAVSIMFMMPKDCDGTVKDKSWVRDIAIEDYLTVKESDWEVPDGGRTYDKKKEVHHYDHVVDHYENVKVAKTRSVQDGYDTSIEYVNNGDGTFSEQTVQTPRYRTETYYETEQRPVYRDDPVYATKYYYEIERWKVVRNVDTKGKEEEPYWGEVKLKGKEREGEKTETYTLVFTTEKKEYTANVSYKLWKSLQKGDKAQLKVQLGDVVKINEEEINE